MYEAQSDPNLNICILYLSVMKVNRPSEPDAVHQDDDEDMRALDQSEKEYNRMISQHVTYHKLLMDDLIKLSSGSETGSGSFGLGLAPGPAQQLLQQQVNQANQANIVKGLGTTVGRMNANREQLMKSASKFVGKSAVNATTVARLNDAIRTNGSHVLKEINTANANAMNSMKANVTEGFVAGDQPNPTLDAALEVSAVMRESHKYALFIFGIFATFLAYKTIKQL